MNPISNGIQTNLTAGQAQAETSKLAQLQKQYLNPTGADAKKLKKAAQEFEAIFVQQMLEQMDKTVDRQDSFLSGGNTEDYWRSMLNEQISKSMSERAGGSGFGLAESIYRQMAENMAKPNESGSVDKGTQ